MHTRSQATLLSPPTVTTTSSPVCVCVLCVVCCVLCVVCCVLCVVCVCEREREREREKTRQRQRERERCSSDSPTSLTQIHSSNFVRPTTASLPHSRASFIWPGFRVHPLPAFQVYLQSLSDGYLADISLLFSFQNPRDNLPGLESTMTP
jgi:hypothetical protein